MEQPVQSRLEQPSVQPSITQPSSDQHIVPETSETNLRSSFKKPIIMAIVISLAVGGVLGFISLQQSEFEEPISTPIPAAITTQPTREPTASHVGTQTITLRDVSGGDSSGTVTRTIAEDYIKHHVTASLPDIPENTFYEFWIRRVDGQDMPLDELRKSDVNDDFILITENYSSISDPASFDQLFNTIVISFETADDFSMETKILEGKFMQ